MSDPGVVERSGLLSAFKRRWAVVLVATALAGVGGYAYASTTSPTYEAEARVLVGPISTDFETLRASGQLTQTYSELARSRPLLRATIRDLALPTSPRELRDDIRSTANDVTRIIAIEVRSGDAASAATIANTLAAKLAAVTPRGSGPEGRIRVVELATPPPDPVWPRTWLIVPLAALAGLLGALVAVMLVEYLRDRVQTDDDLVELAQAPFLGSIDGSRRSPSGPLVVEASPQSRAAASYRLLAANLAFANGDRSVRSVLVVGARDGDGAGEVTANLAAVLAENGRLVTLVDANRSEAEITKLLALEEASGLGEILALAPDESLRRFRTEHSDTMGVVPSGADLGGDVLDVERAKSLLGALSADADCIVVNAAPVQHSPSTLAWARAADMTILVADRGRTKRGEITHAVGHLRRVRANLVGTVARR